MSDENRPPEGVVELTPRLTAARSLTAATLDPDLFGGRPTGRGLVRDVLVVAVNGHPQLAEASRELVRSLQRPSAAPLPPDHEGAIQVAVVAGALGLLLEHQGVGPEFLAEVAGMIDAGRRLYRSPLGGDR